MVMGSYSYLETMLSCFGIPYLRHHVLQETEGGRAELRVWIAIRAGDLMQFDP